MTAAVDSLKYMVRPPAPKSSNFDPTFAYLRVTRGKHTGHLWRGSVEKSEHGTIEVYYSASGEVVRLLNGRIVGAVGLTAEWRQVSTAAPEWRRLLKEAQPVRYVRTRDVMPGYRSGVRDELIVQAVPVPERRTALQVLDPASLTWFEERFAAAERTRSPETLPPALVAVETTASGATAVYGEQCLAPEFCFTWQRWSAALEKAFTQKSAAQ